MEWDREMACMRAKGREEGREKGREEKAVENAVMLIKKYKASLEAAAQDAGAPLDKVLEALEAAPAETAKA